MATFRGKCIGQSDYKYDTWMDVIQNKQDKTSNTSNVTIAMYVKRNDGYAQSAYNLIQKSTMSLAVGGSTIMSTSGYVDTRNSVTVKLAEWRGNIKHENDGSKRITVSGTFIVPGKDVYLDGGSVSGSMDLTKINRNMDPPDIKQFYISNIGKGTFTINAQADHPNGITKCSYTVTNGQWHDFSGTPGKELKTQKVPNLDPNTTYKPGVRFVAGNGVEKTVYSDGVRPFVYVSDLKFASSVPTTLDVGEKPAEYSFTSAVIVQPNNATNPAFTCESSNPDVFSAKTDKQAIEITAKAKGTADLIVKAADGSGKTIRKPITVNQKVTGLLSGASGVVLACSKDESDELSKSQQSRQLSWTILPGNANNQGVIFEVVDMPDNPTGVVEVSPSGLVTAKKEGVCEIHIITDDTAAADIIIDKDDPTAARITDDGKLEQTVICTVKDGFKWRDLPYCGEYLNYYDVAGINENLWYVKQIMAVSGYPSLENALEELFGTLQNGYNIKFEDVRKLINGIEKNICTIVNQMDFISESWSDKTEVDGGPAKGGYYKYDNTGVSREEYGIDKIPTTEQVNLWIDFLNELPLLVAGAGTYWSKNDDGKSEFHPNRVLKLSEEIELRDSEGFRLLISDDPKLLFESEEQ